MAEQDFWRNRIIESGAASPQDLAKGMNPLNWRGHPEAQREALEEALDSIGFLQRVLVNRSSGRVIDGHLRIELAVLKGQPLIPVDYVELTDDEEALALATLDAITEQAEPIADKLAALMERTRAMVADKPGLAGMFDRLKQQAGVNGKGTPKDAEPQIDRAAQLKEKWGIELGQLWQLGEHRLICGDCTDRAVVERVMRGEKAAMVFTDPPYGNNRGYGRGQLGVRFVEGDDNTDLLYELPKIIKPVFNGSFCVIWVQWYTYLELLTAFDGYEIDTVLVWDKKSPGLSGRGGYGEQYEMAVVFVNGKPKRDFFRGNVFTESRHTESEGRNPHPTMKSVSVCEDILKDLSVAGDSVCDPFLGSGTTLIACENLNRRCRAVEVDPGYVGVTLERFYQLTGIEPVLLSK